MALSLKSVKELTGLAGLLRGAGLRPTRQRLGLARLLWEAGACHLTAEQLYEAARQRDLPVSLATVYNTLRQFVGVGLLRELVVGPGRCYFDTNIGDHHHFYYEEQGVLVDIPSHAVVVSVLPLPPNGGEIARVDVVVRVTGACAPV